MEIVTKEEVARHAGARFLEMATICCCEIAWGMVKYDAPVFRDSKRRSRVMDNEGAGPAVSSVQAEELTVQDATLEQGAPVITVQAGRMNVYLDTNGDYYAAYESKYLGDSLLPFPSRNLYDTLVALSPATIPKSTIFNALSLFGNGENSSFGNTGLPC